MDRHLVLACLRDAAAISPGTDMINYMPPFVLCCTGLRDDACIQGLNQSLFAELRQNVAATHHSRGDGKEGQRKLYNFNYIGA